MHAEGHARAPPTSSYFDEHFAAREHDERVLDLQQAALEPRLEAHLRRRLDHKRHRLEEQSRKLPSK